MAITSDVEAVRDARVRIAGELAVTEEPGRVVRALRDRFGYTQETLARLLRMRRESLSRIEGGKVAPSTPFIQRIAGIMALTQAVREHLAHGDARGMPPDEAHLRRLAEALHVGPEEAEEVFTAAARAYEEKKRGLIKILEDKA